MSESETVFQATPLPKDPKESEPKDVEDHKPVQEKPKHVEDHKPVEEKPKPVEDHKPVEEKPKPVEEKPKPVEDESKHVVEKTLVSKPHTEILKAAPLEDHKLVVEKTPAAKTYVEILKADPLFPHVSELLYWKDPVRTGLLFGVINTFYVLLEFFDYTVVTLVSYLALALALVCFSYANFVVLKAKWVQGKDVENPFKERFQHVKFHIPREAVQSHLNTAVDLVNLTVDNVKGVFYATDNTRTALWILYFYVAATVGSWFGGATLLYLASLEAFTWPRLYQEKKKEIDHFYGIAVVETDKYLQLALSKLPPAVAARFPALAAREKKNN